MSKRPLKLRWKQVLPKKWTSFHERVALLDTVTRVERAKTMIGEKIIDHVLEVVGIQANNEHLVYSDHITNQIPRSYAAHAYNVLSQTSFMFAILRIAALWDKADENTASIMTVVEYLDDDKVLEALAEEHRQVNASRGVRLLDKPHPNPSIQSAIKRSIQESQNEFADQQARKATKYLRRAILIAKKISSSSTLISLRNTRDKHVAHALIQTRRERKSPIEPMKYGDEVRLLRHSIWLSEIFYCWVNGTSFDIHKDSRDIARKRAQEFWKNINFQIPDH